MGMKVPRNLMYIFVVNERKNMTLDNIVLMVLLMIFRFCSIFRDMLKSRANFAFQNT